MASWTGGTGAGTKHSLSRNSNEAKASSKKKSSGSGGGGSSPPAPSVASSGANFSTVDGRQVQVTPKGQEVNAPNFSDKNSGPVYVPPPTGGARQYSSGGRNSTPADANFNDAVRGPVNVPAPSPSRASVPSPVASMPAQANRLEGFERRIEAQQQRQERFERFVTEDRGQYKVLGVTMDRPDVQNIRSLSNVLTGGTNLNPFSRNFGIQTDREQRGSFGRVSEDILFGGLSYPFLIGGAVPMAGEKTALTVEAAIRPETRGNVLPELGRAGREVERNEFSFLPGGTPINEAGATTLASAVIFGGLGARPANLGTVKTSGARGPINVEILSVQQGTASGANVRAPIAPRQTTTLRFTEQVRGAQRFTRGRTADTILTIRPDGALSRVTNVGRFRFEIEQAPNAARAIAREYKSGNLVRVRDVPAIKPPKGTPRITELFRSEDARTVVQPRPDVLAQSRQGGRVLQVEQPAGRGRTIVGLLEEVTTSRAVSRAGKTQTTRGATALESRPVARETTVRLRDSELLPSRVFFTEQKGTYGVFNPVTIIEGAPGKGPQLRWNSGGAIKVNIDIVRPGFEATREGRFLYRDTIAHERGHAFASLNLKDINAVDFLQKNARQFAGDKSEVALLQRAGLIEDKSFFRSYKPRERPAEAFAELYKARELYPNMFKELAPKLDNAFGRIDKVRTVRMTEFTTETRVAGEASGLPRQSTTVLRIGNEAQVRAQDMVQSRNQFQRGPLGLDEKGPTRSSGVIKAVKEVGRVETSFEVASVTRGQLFVERGRGRVRSGLDKIQERLEKAFEFEQQRPKAQSRKATEDILNIERPKARAKQRSEKPSDGPLEVINRPARARSRTQNDFFVEGLDVTFAAPRGLDFVQRTGGRNRPAVVPMSRQNLMAELFPSGATQQGIVPGLIDPVVVPRQEQVPIQEITQITTTTEIFRPRPPPQIPQGPFMPTDFGFDSPGSGFPVVGPLAFGGGDGWGFPTGKSGSQRFKNQYAPSIQGGLFKVKGTRKEANIATVTGLGVRPFSIG